MRTRAIFDFHLHHLTNARYHRGGAGVQDWVTPTTSLTFGNTRMSCSMLQSNVIDSVRMRVVSKVITVTVGSWDPTHGGDLVAV